MPTGTRRAAPGSCPVLIGNVCLVVGTIFALLLASTTLYQIEAKHERAKPPTRNATEPLVYKRLRFEDEALQVLNRFKKYFAIDERQVRFSFNETLLADEDHPSNRTELVEHSYYQNDHIEATSLAHDDLVFEAIDASYLTKLIPYFVQSYDNKKDLARAIDKRLVSRSRCDKEMDYLMEQLAKFEHARFDTTRKAGAQLSTSLNAEVLTLLDAFGSEQPGLLMGNHYWPGNWRQCRKSRLFHRDQYHVERSVDFTARYCVASLRSKRWDKLVANRKRELEAEKHFEDDNQRYNYARFHRLQIGVCLPESCDSRLISRRHDDLYKLTVHKLSEPLRSYDLVDLYCLPDETSELRKLEPAAIGLLVFVGVWVSLVALATTLDLLARRRKRSSSPTTHAKSAATTKTTAEKLIDCMSYVRNLERVFETESLKPKPVAIMTVTSTSEHHQASGKHSALTRVTATCRPGQQARTKMQVDRLQFLNCAKVIATMSIVLGHVAMLLKHMDKYTLDYDCVNVWLLHFQFSAVFFVDWHFVISGFLATYIAFSARRVERHTAWSWLGTIVHRYLRLAPLYLLLFWYSQSLFMHTGDGPLWDYATSNQTVRATCRRESFIYPLTLTSNLHPIYEECVMPSWYLSCDFQFFLLTPFLLALLYKSPLLGWLVSLGTIGASVAARLHRYLTDERAQLLGLMRPRYDLYQRNNWDIYPTYIYPQYRIGSYLVGVLAGHYVYMVLSGRWSSLLINKQDQQATSSTTSSKSRSASAASKQSSGTNFYLYLTWGIALFILFYMFIATWFLLYAFPRELEPYADYIGPVVYSISHVTAATGFALFLTCMVLGKFTTVRYFMSLPFWSVLSRFNFIIFIAQIEAINWISGSSDSLIELNNIETFKYSMCLLCVLYLVSGILTPLFEIPIGLLERNFVSPLFALAPAQPSQQQHQQAAQKSHTEPLGLGSPVPTRRNNTVATADAKQAYELGQIAAGESTRLVGSQ